jgi:hypothetical protein
MQLAAYLDGGYVEIHILTDTGKLISVLCKQDSILSVQRHIETMSQDGPEIATWSAAPSGNDLGHPSREPAPPRSTSAAGQRWPWSRLGTTAGYVIVALTCLAAAPAAFVIVDHTVAVHWSNKILDLAGI